MSVCVCVCAWGMEHDLNRPVGVGCIQHIAATAA